MLNARLTPNDALTTGEMLALTFSELLVDMFYH